MRHVLLVIVLLTAAVTGGCTAGTKNPTLTVTSLDNGDIPFEPVGKFDIYTASFQIRNPTNITVENVGVDITLLPKSAYCHGITKTFSYPRLVPQEKRNEQFSIAEFGDLGCMYNYTYQVSSGSG